MGWAQGCTKDKKMKKASASTSILASSARCHIRFDRLSSPAFNLLIHGVLGTVDAEFVDIIVCAEVVEDFHEASIECPLQKNEKAFEEVF